MGLQRVGYDSATKYSTDSTEYCFYKLQLLIAYTPQAVKEGKFKGILCDFAKSGEK